MQVKSLVTEILQTYDIGLTLIDVKIQDAEPPTQEVIEAFKAVETAKQKAETVVNDAKAYQNAKLPDAQAQADKLIQNAEAVVNDAVAYKNAQLPKAQAEADKLLQNAQYLKQKRINEAIQAVAMFEAMYAEYARNPQITRSRMYYEAIQEILPGVRVFINTGDGSNVEMFLPLDSLTGGN